MGGTEIFGYSLIALSAVLLAQHWQQRLEAPAQRSPAVLAYLRRQLQRRSVASALIGVLGAAMTLVDRVPRNPVSLSAYLFALVLGGAVILAIALADLRASRHYRESQQLDLLAQELRKATGARANSE
jgi:drug/metabolite transporter (DMT)-like permease